MQKFVAVVSGLALGVLVVGCDGGRPLSSEPESEPALSSQPIINGWAPDAPRHDAVVAILTVKGPYLYLCSGTLIAPDTIVSAAHCFEKGKNDPSKIRVRFGNFPLNSSGTPDWGAAYSDPTNLMASAVWMHPNYNGGALTNDISMVRLSQPVCSVAPVPYLDNGSLLVSGRSVNFAGFGLDNHPNTPAGDANQPDVGTKFQVDNLIGGVANPCTAGGSTFTCLQGPGHQVWYDETNRGACSGDSGGPMFIDVDPNPLDTVQQWRVAAVTSYGDSNCALYGVSTRTDAFKTELDAFIAGGQGCTAGAVCGNGARESGEACDGSDHAGASCESLGLVGGTLGCKADCTFDVSSCTGAQCSEAAVGDACSSDGDCCSGKCKGAPGKKTCR